MAKGAHELDQVRDALRRLGYLDHKVQRFLLQDALRPRRPWRALLRLAAKVGLIAGGLVALVWALYLALVNGHLEASPFDLLPLFFHLIPPLAFGIGLAFLAVAGLLVLVLRLSHVRRIEAVSFALAVLTTGGAVVVATWQSRAWIAGLGSGALLALAVAVPLLAYALVKVVHGGLLTLAIRFTDRAPEGRNAPWLWAALAGALAVFLLLVPAVLDVQRTVVSKPAGLPRNPAARVLLIGVDGVAPAELDFLLGSGAMPASQALLTAGGALVPYARPAGPPAAFWTTVATGLADREHGVAAVDSFRPRGMARPLARSGWLRPYWVMVGAPLGLVEYRPLLAQTRRAHTVWELAAGGDVPVLAVDWWGTFPAEPLAGVVIAHGAYQLLAEDAAGTVFPAAAEPVVRSAAETCCRQPAPFEAGLAAVLPPAVVRAVDDKAVRPDRFYRAVFRHYLAAAPRVAALYLPGLDILPEVAEVGTTARGAMAAWQLAAVDALVAEAGDAVDTVVLVFDPGRRGGDEGRVLWWNAAGPCAGREPIDPRAIAAGLLRTLGMPQSAELPSPPAICAWSPPSLLVDTYGPRQPQRGGVPSSEEYLESLRSLGYI